MRNVATFIMTNRDARLTYKQWRRLIVGDRSQLPTPAVTIQEASEIGNVARASNFSLMIINKPLVPPAAHFLFTYLQFLKGRNNV